MKTGSEPIIKLPFLEKLFCFFILWGSGTGLTLKYSYVYYAIVVTFALIVLGGGFRYKRSMIIPIIGSFILLAISLYLNTIYMGGRGAISTINNFIIILCSILFAMNKAYLNKKRLETIFHFFLIFSIISTFLFVIYFCGLLPVKLISEESHVSTYYFLLNVAPSDLIADLNRNGGIYWEPGMYQVFLNIILIYYLFNNHLRHRKAIIVYLIVMIISTISVSGYALTILIIGIYALNNNNKNGILRFVTMAAILFAIVIVIPNLMALFTAKEETGSFGKRSLDLILAWDVFLKHPFFGHGIVNDAYEKAYFSLVGELRPSSNGLMNLLMGTGVLGASFFFYCYTRSLKFFSKEYTKRIVLPLLLWLLISINTEPIQYQPFIHFLFGVGFAYCYQLTQPYLNKAFNH